MQIKNHLWYKKKFKDSDGSLIEPEIATSPPRKSSKNHHQDDSDIVPNSIKLQPSSLQELERQCASQPANFKSSNQLSRTPSVGHSAEKVDGFGGFTQPAQLSDLLGSSQSTQAATQSSRFQRLVKRMTRFWVKVSLDETDKFLHGLLEKMHYTVKCKPKGIFTIETQDRRGAILSFRCTLIQVDNRILVDFRLSRGCGIEFKKHFAKVKTNSASIIEKGPIMWPTLIAHDAIPGKL